MYDVTSPKLLLRLEGLAVFLVALLMYRELDASWWMFALLFLVPDLSMVGYLSGTAVGAALYNLVHSYVLPIFLYAIGLMSEHASWMAIAFVWAAHIGADRILGFGLKYTGAFRDTHLGRV